MLKYKPVKLSGVVAVVGLAWLAVACGKSETIVPPNANVNTINCFPGTASDPTGQLCSSASTIEQRCAWANGRLYDAPQGRLCETTLKYNLKYKPYDHPSLPRLTPTSPIPVGSSVSVGFPTVPNDRIEVSGKADYGQDKDTGHAVIVCNNSAGNDFDIDRDGFNSTTSSLVTNSSNGLNAGLILSNGKQSIALFQGGPSYSFTDASDVLYLGFNASASPSKPCYSFDLQIRVKRCFNLAGQTFPCL